MGVTVAIDAVADPPRESAGNASPPVEAPAGRQSRVSRVSVSIVVVIGLLITAGLSFGARSLHDSNENRLLKQRAREVGAVVSASLPAVQTPLASASVLAEATNGNVSAFRQLVGPLAAGGRPFASVSLWSTQSASPRLLTFVGVRPELAGEPRSDAQTLFRHASGAGALALNNLLASDDRRLGYALTLPGPRSRFVVYAEAKLPKDRRAAIDKDSAFADLGYALYLGPSVNAKFLLASSTGGALPDGRRTSITVPFADSKLLVVLTPHAELGGSLLAQLWWMLGGLGLIITLGAAALVERLTRRRRDAEDLAVENARLYAQQRSVAQTLQHSLLAEAFPEVGGLEFAAKYVAGVEGMDIGGDWYDVLRLDRGHVLLVVGDVSGRGLEAATMMAALRYSARAYAVEGHAPAVILTKLSGLVSIAVDGHFATILCALLDVTGERIVLANAGHPEPLLVSPTGAAFVATTVGVPVGVGAAAPYAEVEFAFPRGSTLLLYTDGAVERRGEDFDVGLQRLKDASLRADGSLEAVLTQIVDVVLAGGAEDDTALLGVRWRN